MIRLIVWGIVAFIFYIFFQMAKFFLNIGRTINKVNQNTNQAAQQQPGSERKNPANIVEAEFVEIESKINKKEEQV